MARGGRRQNPGCIAPPSREQLVLAVLMMAEKPLSAREVAERAQFREYRWAASVLQRLAKKERVKRIGTPGWPRGTGEGFTYEIG
jgi:hypothetical protein